MSIDRPHQHKAKDDEERAFLELSIEKLYGSIIGRLFIEMHRFRGLWM